MVSFFNDSVVLGLLFGHLYRSLPSCNSLMKGIVFGGTTPLVKAGGVTNLGASVKELAMKRNSGTHHKHFSLVFQSIPGMLANSR